MTPQEYVKQAVRTESTNFEIIKDRLTPQTIRGLHAAVGISTEAGELLDAFKKFVYYGKPLDAVNVKEEISDCLWYIAVMCDAYGFDMEEVMARNIAKLKMRYPDKFTEKAAQVRDLDAERNVLEQTVAPWLEKLDCPLGLDADDENDESVAETN